jgi:hypothetical protein
MERAADGSIAPMSKDSMGSRAALTALLSWLLSWAILSSAPWARADDNGANGSSTQDAEAYGTTIRAAAGLGAGQIGAAGRLAVSGERWFGDNAGLGAFFDASGQSTVCLLCPATKEAAQSVGLTLAARTAGRDSYGFFAVGGGYAWARRSESEGLELYNEGSPPPDTHYSGGIVNMSSAWLFHPGELEIGPLVVANVTTWGSITFTANLALGLALQ